MDYVDILGVFGFCISLFCAYKAIRTGYKSTAVIMVIVSILIAVLTLGPPVLTNYYE